MIDLGPPGAVRWICRTLEEAGHEAWAVGGAVRDALAGLPSGDWDLATSARPGEVRRLFRRTVPIGIEHGTVGVLARDGTLYEVTTFRRDVETTGRHAVVSFAETLDEDLARRDFTINAVAWHPLRKAVHDPYGGARDLERGLLRTVGDPAARFREDYLRVLRALRFAGTFRLLVDPATWRALAGAVPHLDVLSPERVREELEKILAGAAPPSAALSLYAASGALGFLYPELEALVGTRPSAADRWSRALGAVDLLPPARPELRWVALLAGVGATEGGMGAGEGDEDAPRRALLRAAALLKRLRSSNARIDRVSGAVEWADFPPEPDADEAALRRWLARAGRDRLPDLLRVWASEVRLARALGARAGGVAEGIGAGTRGPGSGWTVEGYLRLARRLRAIVRSGTPLEVGELAFSGRDLIRMGHRPGPYFGRLLRHLLDRVLEDPALNVTDRLAAEAEAWIARGEGRPGPDGGTHDA